MEYLIIGQVARPHGVRGELKINPITDDPKRFSGLKRCYKKVGDTYVEMKIKSSRVTASEVIILFDEIPDRNTAETYRGEYLYIDRKNSIKLPEGRYFISDLIGLEVYDDSDNYIGKLSDVLQPGANDVYVVKNDKQTIMMPALKTLMLKVDIANGKMIVSAQRLAEVALFED